MSEKRLEKLGSPAAIDVVQLVLLNLFMLFHVLLEID